MRKRGDLVDAASPGAIVAVAAGNYAENVVIDDGTGKAIDQFTEIRAVGAGGLAAPTPNFLAP